MAGYMQVWLVTIFMTLTFYLSVEAVKMKLIGGRGSNEGNVYVNYGTRWGLVCDDGWNARAARVVCRQLGFKGLRRLTKFNYFKTSLDEEIFLDDVRCRGREQNLAHCRHNGWFRHNCGAKEAAGVVCEPPPPPTTPKPKLTFRVLGSITTTPTIPTKPPTESQTPVTYAARPTIEPGAAPVKTIFAGNTLGSRTNNIYIPPNTRSSSQSLIKSLELVGGRKAKEGYVKVHLSNSVSGTICPQGWGLPEAKVICRQLGLNYADRATSSDFFRGGHEKKVLQTVECAGNESNLNECRITVSSESQACTLSRKVSGVICTSALPDLEPNITMLVESISIQDRYMAYLTCALEEECLSSSAYTIKEKHPRSWNHISRRLLRFSSSIANIGTADFRPRQHRSSWEWHECHMHYHSMNVFTHYDVLAYNGTRMAEGHKASFCLEDVQCQEGYKKRYSCRGHSNQGISVGCSDVYKHDIDCQWIDITDLEPGKYVFKLNVNPEYIIPELSFDNNAAVCDLNYSGYDAKLENCVHQHG